MKSSTVCHCGRPVEPRDPDPWEGRLDDYCEDCALNRCDCYPDQCPVLPLTDADYKRAANDMPEKIETEEVLTVEKVADAIYQAAIALRLRLVYESDGLYNPSCRLVSVAYELKKAIFAAADAKRGN